MADQDLIGENMIRRPRPSPWVVAAFVGSCAFTCGALLLLIFAWNGN